MERFVVLPFSIGSCASHSSVDVIDNPFPAKKSKHDSDPSSIARVQGEGGGDNLSGVKMKTTISIVIQRLIKSIKTLSHLFVYKDEVDEEMEMEIGLPTDVKHVTHIGWDGSSNTTTTTKNPLKKDCLWDTFKAHPNQDQLFSSLTTSSISLKQFELAMAAQATNTNHHDASITPPLVFGSSFHNPKPTTTTTSC